MPNSPPMTNMADPVSLATIDEIERLVEMAETIKASADGIESRLLDLRQRQVMTLMVLHVALVLLTLAFSDAGAWRWAAAPVVFAGFMHIWFDGRQISRLRTHLKLEVHVQNRAVDFLRETEQTLMKDAGSIRQALIKLRLTRFPIERQAPSFWRSR